MDFFIVFKFSFLLPLECNSQLKSTLLSIRHPTLYGNLGSQSKVINIGLEYASLIPDLPFAECAWYPNHGYCVHLRLDNPAYCIPNSPSSLLGSPQRKTCENNVQCDESYTYINHVLGNYDLNQTRNRKWLWNTYKLNVFICLLLLGITPKYSLM